MTDKKIKQIVIDVEIGKRQRVEIHEVWQSGGYKYHSIR